MQRGEIWWADLPKPDKSEPGFRRPVLIIQNNLFNKSKINTVICCIITSNLQLGKAPGNIILAKDNSKLPKKSVVNVSQIVTLDKRFLSEYVSTLSKRLIDQVESGIKLVLNL
ncbi:MAG: type II toxin-antitoxin system PemK/MazF family toxin [bacterium]